MTRRTIIILAAAGGFILLVALAIAIYAVSNLNSLIERNQARVIKILSDALERPVQVDQVSARVGLGVWIEISGLKIADDPAFSQEPFLTAPRTTLEVDVLPILSGHVRVHTLTLVDPSVRVIEKEDGSLNTDTIGGPPGKPTPVSPIIASFFVSSVEIQNGSFHYSNEGEEGAPIELHHLDAEIDDFGLLGDFKVDTKLAFLQDAQNLTASGSVGPLLHKRMVDTSSIPLDLQFKADPFVVDQLKTLAGVGTSLPAELSMPDPISISGTLKGEINALNFDITGDMGAGSIAYSTDFKKPPKLPMTVEAKGSVGLISNTFNLDSVHLQLADLAGTLSDMAFPDTGPSHIHVETNNFDLTDVTTTVPMLDGFRMTGKAQAHVTLDFGDGPFASDGSVVLTGASIGASQGKMPGLADLNATIVLKGQTITLQPSTFSVASAHARASGVVSSVKPLQTTYQFDADTIRPSAFVPTRPQEEVLNKVHVEGSLNGDASAPRVAARITSASGVLNGAAYQNLDVTGSYADKRLAANPLSVGAFSGTVVANGSMTMTTPPRFDVNANLRNVDLQQAFLALDPKTQRRLRGSLSGNVRMSGSGKDWNAIKPTLNGNGNLQITNGKIAGVNIVAIAINKIAAAPGVSQIVNATFMSDHSGMLADPDTELQNAQSTFVIVNQRVTTHDLAVKSTDYALAGDGWFDFDNNISMSMDIKLTFGLSVTIPVYITGRPPLIVVVPDIPKLAERIAMGAISVPGKIIEGGVSGFNSLIGRSTPAARNTPSSGGSGPLDKLKGFFQ